MKGRPCIGIEVGDGLRWRGVLVGRDGCGGDGGDSDRVSPPGIHQPRLILLSRRSSRTHTRVGHGASRRYNWSDFAEMEASPSVRTIK